MAKKAVAEAAAKKAAAEAAAAKAAAAAAAEEAAKVAEVAAEVVAAEINNKSKSSEIFANAYKNQHTTSHKLQFYFKIDKIVKRSTHFNGKRRESNEKINVILLNHHFIYDNMNIYMSSNEYSPLSYKEYFTRNIQNINTFFTNFIELLIYIELLNQHINLLNGNDFNNFLYFLKPILEEIKYLFFIDLNIDLIKNYSIRDSYQNKYTPEKYECSWSLEIDGNKFNPITTDIKTHLDLDETVESMVPAKFATKKADMNKKFNDDVQNKMTRCAKDPKSYNCIDGKRNLNAEYNKIMGLAPTE